MSEVRAVAGVPHHFVAAIGAGPANLSLAALGERQVPGGVAVFDKQPRPGWHPGLLVQGARLQTSWIKDLVTLVEPCNRFSFLNYLVSTGRIYSFLNAQWTSVPRQEFARYLAWAAERLDTVHYGCEITEVGFDERFVLRGPDRVIATCDHLVFGLGTRPNVPPCFPPNLPGVVLAEELVQRDFASRLPSQQVIVVGGGQTGAEAVLSLARRGVRDIRWLGRRHWFAPLDDSPPANDFYRPAYLRFFYDLPEHVRRAYVAQQVLTSDGVSNETLQEIYRFNYEASLTESRPPIMLLPGRDVIRAHSRGGLVSLWCRRNSGGNERHSAPLVVLSTGRTPTPLPLAPELREQLELDDAAEPLVEQDYSVRWKHGAEHRLFVQNRSIFTHGLADPNLSLLAVRSAVILNSLLQRTVFEVRDEFVQTMWG